VFYFSQFAWRRVPSLNSFEFLRPEGSPPNLPS
jgi:hypothetical protein